MAQFSSSSRTVRQPSWQRNIFESCALIIPLVALSLRITFHQLKQLKTILTNRMRFFQNSQIVQKNAFYTFTPSKLEFRACRKNYFCCFYNNLLNFQNEDVHQSVFTFQVLNKNVWKSKTKMMEMLAREFPGGRLRFELGYLNFRSFWDTQFYNSGLGP